ncbi:MAG: succinate--CoA ligase subunit alpha [Dehalococcoidia bacterium]|tara:strand:- start:2136 stop:3020 length:885 start_codon:yes stop_codon:yes gene_type:complete
MSVLLNSNSKIIIQGMGSAGAREAEISINYGTNIVAGVTPGKGGTEKVGVPICNTVKEAIAQYQGNTSLIFVPAPFCKDAIIEAILSGIKLIMCITEGVPVKDMMEVNSLLQKHPDTILIGPNCPGVLSPGEHARAGIMPIDVYMPGNIGVISRSGTLVYETVDQLTRLNIGQSTSVGVGGDPIIGTSQKKALELFEADSETAGVVLIGEIGGSAEQEAAEYIKQMSKPVISFIAGTTAPPGRRMGHAGAIISGASGTAKAKQDALKSAGASVVMSPSEIGTTVQNVLKDIGLL